MLYPLKFIPIYKEKIWGGNKIRTLRKDNAISEKCGESWEISAIEDNLSVVAEGFLKGNNIQELIEIYMGDLVGDQVYEKFGVEFPLLVKIIHAAEDLSVQVHPDNEFAMKQHHAYGKSELWYILEAENDAKLISGFSRNIKPEEFLQTAKDGAILNICNIVPAIENDVHYIPAGRIHALGKGIMLLEIQQTSDITYRIFDYNRKDNRDLHIDLAAEVLDFKKCLDKRITYEIKHGISNNIISNDKFVVNYLHLQSPLRKELLNLDSFVIYYCLKGSARLITDDYSCNIDCGETILIPADITEISIFPERHTELIEIYMDFENEYFSIQTK